jgi:hypothetical protein
MTTSTHSTENHTPEQLTLFPEASHASRTVQPENDLEQPTSATCGPKCLELFERLPRAGLWARTFAGLLLGQEGWYSRKCALTWRLLGTKYNRSYFLLQASERRTKGIGFGLLLTPDTVNKVEHPYQFRKRMDQKKYKNRNKWCSLASQISFLATPNARDHKGKSQYVNKPCLPNQIGQKDGLVLRPAFVEWMMGFPEGWTDIEQTD